MLTDYVTNGIKNHELINDSTLHVVAVVSNPARYHSRYRLFREFANAMATTPNTMLHVVELAFGDRHHEVTGKDCPTPSQLQLRSDRELWHKENMINLGVRHLLPTNWRYMAWIDADVHFQNKNWALETIHQLQHYPVVQPWSECVDMGPHGNGMQMFRSFCSFVQRGKQIQSHPGEYYEYAHSGFAWACTRRFWENVGGLIDWAVLGSGDHHMAWGLINQIHKSVHQSMSGAFKRRANEWQANAYRETNGHVACVPGLLHHQWHGKKAARKYRERWQILIDNKFDPDTDLRRDAQGLLYIAGKPHLENDIREYMRGRNEDGIDED